MDEDSSLAAAQLVRDALCLSTADRARQFAQDLPVLTHDQVPLDDYCPICLVPFLEILQDDPGVTKLEGCGHIFCRRDLIEWVKTQHGNCPTCRFQFMPLDAGFGDDASSDGGEYIPPSEGDEDLDLEYDYAESENWDYDDDLEIAFYAREAMMPPGDDDDDVNIVDQNGHGPPGDSEMEEFDYEQELIGPAEEDPDALEEYDPELDPFSCFDPVNESDPDPDYTPEGDNVPDEMETLDGHERDGCYGLIDPGLEADAGWALADGDSGESSFNEP